MALYTDTVMDHFMHPRNVGEIADADGVGEVGNAKCGDIMTLAALGGLPAHKLHCSVLAEEAVKSAVKNYYDRNGIAYDKSKFPDCESCRMV